MSRRVTAFAAILIAVVIGVNADAQVNPFVGLWRGVYMLNGMPVTFNLVMGEDQSYSQQEVSRLGMTLQKGVYRVAGQVIAFEVLDWEPKYYSPPNPIPYGGPLTRQRLAKPPGGTFRFQFTSPRSFTLQDVNFGGVITFNRVQ